MATLLFFWGGKKVRPHLFSVMPSSYWFIFPVNRNDLELPLKKIEKQISFDLDFFELNIKLIYHWNSFRSSLWVFPSLAPKKWFSSFGVQNHLHGMSKCRVPALGPWRFWLMAGMDWEAKSVGLPWQSVVNTLCFPCSWGVQVPWLVRDLRCHMPEILQLNFFF